MFVTTDDDLARGDLGLEMALEAQDLVPFRQHALVHGTVGGMARGAALPQGFVFENERTPLGGMTLEAGFVGARHRSSPAFHRPPLVRVMAVAAADFAFLQRVMVGGAEAAFLVEMTLIAGFGGLPRVDDCPGGAARFDVDTGGAVAGFAADIVGIGALGLEAGVITTGEMFGLFGVAFGATL